MQKNDYHIGGVDVRIRRVDADTLELAVLQGHESPPDPVTGQSDPAKGETANALTIIENAIPMRFNATISGRDDKNRVYTITQTSHDPVLYKIKPPASPVQQLVDYIFDGKRMLTDDELHDFMQALAQNFNTPQKVARSVEHLAKQRQKRAALTIESVADQRSGRQELKRLVQHTDKIKHLLRPVVYALAKHGIGGGDEFVDAVIFGLLEGYDKASLSEREQIPQLANRYVASLADKLSQIGIDAADTAEALKDNLFIDIARAEQQRTKKDRGMGAA